jgi:UDP-N-acetylglucosamine 2-epimerase
VSSGLTEAPSFSKGAVNIGDRQKGRLKAQSVIDVLEVNSDIITGVRQALSPEFQSLLSSVQSWYGSGNVSLKIKETLKSVTLQTRKSFFDIGHVL